MKKDINDTKKIVLEQIRKGEVLMRPQWHFVLKSVLAFFGIAITGVLAIYLISFIMFVLRSSGLFFAPMLGPSGFIIFVLASPWLLIVLAVGFMITLEVLVRKYAFGYRKPLLYTGLIIVGVVTVGVYLISQTPMHRHFLEIARDGDITFISSMYREYGEQLSNHIYTGIISEVTNDGYVMQDHTGVTRKVVIDSNTFLPEGTMFQVGKKVVILGEIQTDTSLYARGTRIMPDDIPFPPPFLKDKSLE
jgi:hypothetical protein